MPLAVLLVLSALLLFLPHPLPEGSTRWPAARAEKDANFFLTYTGAAIDPGDD
jgi:hypothetical protein